MKRVPKQLAPPALCGVVFAWLAAAAAHAQTDPAITQQPADQAVVVGSQVTLTVGVSGTGPFTYQWRLNGTNLPKVITTVAGNANTGYSGDGGAATNAKLNSPAGVAIDAFGNLFIADSRNNRIRKVGTNGIITTVAGKTAPGSSGDGGAATNATLSDPSGVAADAFGNVFIADANNNRLREVGTNGIIATVAGKTSGFSGDGGAATNAQLNDPSGVAVDAAGDLFIADSVNSRIREVGTNGIINTVAGNGTNGFSGDGGAATNAKLNSPAGVAIDAFGNLFIADTGNNRIREVGTSGIITTVAGKATASYFGDGGLATNASLNRPQGVSVDAFGNVFIADTQNNRIREVATNGIITTVVGNGSSGYSGDGGNPTNTSIYAPQGLSVDAFGNLFIADTYNNRIRKAFIQGPTLQLNNMSSNTAGGYDVIVTGANGSVTSSVATVTVLLPPSITAQPQAVAAVGGSDVSLTVAVAGTAPFGYQWQFDGTNLVDNGQITGSQTNALSLSSIDLTDQGSYEVIVTNAYGSVTSSVATLTLLLPPSITTQPQGGTATNGSNVALTVAVSGTAPFTYQWRQNGANLPTVITTVAGNGASGYAGDNGPATNASLTYATSVAVDASGNLFIGDAGNCHIRKVRTNGIISTVAGNGSDFYSGDGGAATGAGLDPYCVVVDASGNLFVADMFNNRVRKIGTNGTISTVAGAGTQGFSGDGGAATSAKLRFPWCAALDASGNLFIADSGNNRIRKVTNGIINTVAGNGTNGCSGDGGLATNAALGNPEGVTVDALGNLFIADFNNNRIRKVGTNGIITTVAGGGIDYPGDGGAATNASLCNPSGVAVDAFGNLFIADGGDNRIREVTTNGVITTVAGGGIHIPGDGGAATGAALYAPSGVSVDAAGDLFIADTGNNRIREVPIPGPTLALHGVTAGNDGSYDVIVSNAYGCVTSDVAVLTVQGPPPSISVQPQDGLAVVGGTFTLTVAVSGPGPFTCQWQGNGVNLPSLITTVAGGGTNNFGDGGAATNASLLQPFGAAVDAFGNLFIADRNRNNIRKVGTNGIINTVAGSAVGVVGYLGDGSPAIAALLALPCGVAVDPYGNLFIADTFFSHIRKVSNVSPYDISTVAGVAGKITNGYSGDGVAATNTPLNGPYDVVLDASGSLLIADTFNHRIRRVPNNGLIFTVAGIGTNSYSGDGGPATNAAINTPCGVAADALGNFFIADTSNNCVRVVDTNGIITTVAGTGTPGFSGDGGAATNASLALPQGVAVDAFGNLFIADTGNNCIRVVDGNGIITTVAGNGTNGFSGDGGAATNASLDLPSRVAVDAYGNLFIADLANRRIRKVSIQTPILQLSQIAAGSAGVYDLVVSNAYGAVTSAVVTLTVALPPFSAGLSAGQGVQFQFSGTANSSYVLQAATDLTPPVNWQPLVTNAADTNGNWTFTDTNTAANTARFYRLASP